MSARTNKQKTVMSIKIDKKTHIEAKKLADKLGISMSQIVNETFRRFIREKEFNFSESGYRMKPALEKIIKKAEEDLKKGKNISPPFTSTEEMFKWLKI